MAKNSFFDGFVETDSLRSQRSAPSRELRIKSPRSIGTGELEKGYPSEAPLVRVPVLYASQHVTDERADESPLPNGASSGPSAPAGNDVADFATPASGPEPKWTDPRHAVECGDALAAAAAAGRFDIVAQLTRELEARRQMRAGKCRARRRDAPKKWRAMQK
jgi:hypothetical protein